MKKDMILDTERDTKLGVRRLHILFRKIFGIKGFRKSGRQGTSKQYLKRPKLDSYLPSSYYTLGTVNSMLSW